MNDTYDKHIEGLKAEIRNEVIAEIRLAILETLDTLVEKPALNIPIADMSKVVTKPGLKHKRRRTVASEQDIAKVVQVFTEARTGLMLTIKQVDKIAKVGRTTCSKACCALMERGWLQKTGLGYRQVQAAANGADQATASV